MDYPDHMRKVISRNEVEPLNWCNSEKLNYENMVKLDTHHDFSSILHAILKGYSSVYITSTYNGKRIDRCEYIDRLRKDFATKLPQPSILTNLSSPTNYQLLVNTFREGSFFSSYTMEQLISRLNSNEFMGDEYLFHISELLGKDVYVLDEITEDVYETVSKSKDLHKDRNSIVIAYAKNINKFSLVGILNARGEIETYFKPGNPFIVAIKKRISILDY